MVVNDEYEVLEAVKGRMSLPIQVIKDNLMSRVSN